MQSRAVIVFAVIFCLFVGYCSCSHCTEDGESCQTKNECCNDVKCKKPPHTCGGICNSYSCSGTGLNRPQGMACDGNEGLNQCDQTGAPPGYPILCKRPEAKTCDGKCPQCAPPI